MDRFDKAGQAFADLCRVMAKLRAPGGCPWDHEQTLTSLKPYLIEEAYEVIDAIDAGDMHGLTEELGDLMLQAVFQAEIANEAGDFDITAVCHAIEAKLIRRHPHVFAERHADSASSALRHWEEIKAEERRSKPGNKSSRLDGIPKSLPGLLRAVRTGEKAASVGFDWSRAADVLSKVDEEWMELREALDSTHDGAHEDRTEELGDLLFSVANWARHLKLDPEHALARAIEKFQTRFRVIESRLEEFNRRPEEMSLDDLEAMWEEAKLQTTRKPSK